jgi:hypothetical protein
MPANENLQVYSARVFVYYKFYVSAMWAAPSQPPIMDRRTNEQFIERETKVTEVRELQG